jgi:polyvinyl alcohol dehydrogenase (cytochrome)
VFGVQFPYQAIFSSATMVGKNVAIGISSLEEGAVLTPNYPCCTFRGSLVLLDPADGRIIWQTFMTGVAQPGETDGNPNTVDFGPSGATIWSTPTYDRGMKTIYATTGNNYSKPTTGTSDAIVAFDAADGRIKWVSQKTQDDFWNFRFLPKDEGDPPDFDFGDSPQIYKIRGRTVVGAGQKSGFYHVVDARTGKRITEFQATEIGGSLGGLFADSAFADGVAFTNGSNWPDPFGSPNPPIAGVISAIAGDGSSELWRFETPGSPNLSGVAVANGVLYFQSMTSGLYALNASNGDLLAQVDINMCDGSSPVCGQTSGPAVSRGQVYVGTGDIMSFLFDVFRPFAPGAILALGVHGARHHEHAAWNKDE